MYIVSLLNCNYFPSGSWKYTHMHKFWLQKFFFKAEKNFFDIKKLTKKWNWSFSKPQTIGWSKEVQEMKTFIFLLQNPICWALLQDKFEVYNRWISDCKRKHIIEKKLIFCFIFISICYMNLSLKFESFDPRFGM